MVLSNYDLNGQFLYVTVEALVDCVVKVDTLESDFVYQVNYGNFM